jgi:hypothetical protein
MNRETIIAIVVGILFGAILGLVVLSQTNKGDKSKAMTPVKDNLEKQKPNTKAVVQETVLKINKPENNLVSSTKEIEISGKAPAKSLIVIQSPIANKVFKTDKEDFSIKFSLAQGENTISISSYTQGGSPQERQLQIYYVTNE